MPRAATSPARSSKSSPAADERAAPELELLGVVAEEPEVAGTRAGGDAGADRLEHAGGALAHQLVEVRRGRFLELGAVVGVGVAAQPVHHDEEDLGVGRLDQRREVHDQTLLVGGRPTTLEDVDTARA